MSANEHDHRQVANGMRILIDGFWWCSGPPSGRLVVRETVFGWLRQHPYDELVLAVPAADVDAARKALPSVVEVIALRLRPHAAAAILELPVLAKRYRAELILAQSFTPLRGRSAVFVHDALFQSNPEWFTTSERAYLAPIPLLARRAAVVLTSTRVEADRIRTHNPAIARVEPVDLAVATELIRAEPKRPTGIAEGLPFVLSFGRLNVRKNLATTLLAAARSPLVDPKHPLVVVGEPEGKAETFPPDVQEGVDDGTIVFLGVIDDGELKWLYQQARLLVCVSLDEGFGLPPVEATAFGCPVLVSDLPVFRETLGDAASYVDPCDVDTIAAALGDAAIHARRGLQAQPPLHSWDRTVKAKRDAMSRSATTTPKPDSPGAFDRLVRRAYRSLRGRELPSATPTAVLTELAARFGRNAVHGTLASLRYGQASWPHIRGRRSAVRYPWKLTVGRGVVIGDDVVIEAFSRAGVHLADRVTVARGAALLASGVVREPGEGITVGADSAIGAYNIIWGQGGVTIGRNCLLAPHVVMVSENHGYSDPDVPIRMQPVERAPIVVGDDCWLGAGVTVVAGVTIGPGCVVGAGSVVTRDLPLGSIAVGAPARVVGQRGGHSHAD